MRTEAPDAYRPTRADLAAAIAGGEIVVYYQSKIDLLASTTGKFAGVEALARWNYPRHGLIPPMRFTPLAEQMVLIEELTWNVLRRATGQLNRWAAGGAAGR